MKMKKAIVAIAIAGALAFAALNYHVIHLDGGVKILKKNRMTFSGTYVDARGIKKHKLLTKPELIKAGIKKVFEDVKSKVK
jgi:hypothetical protein